MIFFFNLVFFLISSFNFIFLMSFMVFFNLFSFWLSRYHDLGHVLTQLYSLLIIQVICLSCYLGLTRTTFLYPFLIQFCSFIFNWLETELYCFSHFENRFFCLKLLWFFLNFDLFTIISDFFYHLIKIEVTYFIQ